MKRRSLNDAECPVARALDAIGDWWSLLIVRDAFDGARRFGDFQRNLGVAKGILAARLRHLVELGIFALVPAANGGAHQEYVLTEKGRGLFLVVVSLRQWGEAHLYQPGEGHSTLVDSSGRPVAVLALRDGTGNPLDSTGTHVRKLGDKHRPTP